MMFLAQTSAQAKPAVKKYDCDLSLDKLNPQTQRMEMVASVKYKNQCDAFSGFMGGYDESYDAQTKTTVAIDLVGSYDYCEGKNSGTLKVKATRVAYIPKSPPAKTDLTKELVLNGPGKRSVAFQNYVLSIACRYTFENL